MKFKVGQKVRMVEDNCDARVGDIGIIRALPKGEHSYAVEFPCFSGCTRGHDCDGLVPSRNGHWIHAEDMELAREQEEPMTLKEKLKAFKSGTAVLHAPTQELWDKLMVELEKQGYKWKCGDNPTDRLWDDGNTVIGTEGYTYAIVYWHGTSLPLEISPQDFPEITQVTIKDDSGTTTVRAKVTKGNDGYTIEKLAEPKFTMGEQFVTASGKLGKVTKVNPEGNYCVQWFNGKHCSAQPEDTMRKIVWDK